MPASSNIRFIQTGIPANPTILHNHRMKTLSDISADTHIVELPVYLVAYEGKDMVVTDFSPIHNSMLAGNSIKADSLRTDYRVNHLNTLPENKLLYIRLNCTKENLLPLRGNVQYTHFYELAMLIIVKIRVCRGLDGIYAELIQWKKLSSHCKDFIIKFKENVSPSIYKIAMKYEESFPETQPSGSLLPFKPIYEDSQAPLFSDSDEIEDEEAFNDPIPGDPVMNDSTGDETTNTVSVKNESSEARPPSPLINLTNELNEQTTIVNLPTDYQDLNDPSRIIKSTSLEKLLNIDVTEAFLNRNLTIEVTGSIIGVIPYGQFIIKPYNRTVKIARFSLILKHKTNQINLEFLTDDEMCHFFGLIENEDCLDRIKELYERFGSLINHSPPKVLKVKVKFSSKLVNDSIYTYWACASTLNELLAD